MKPTTPARRVRGLQSPATIAKRTRTRQRQIAASIAQARARRRPGIAG